MFKFVWLVSRFGVSAFGSVERRMWSGVGSRMVEGLRLRDHRFGRNVSTWQFGTADSKYDKIFSSVSVNYRVYIVLRGVMFLSGEDKTVLESPY